MKRGKTRVTESWLLLVFTLIGRESSASFLDQSQNRKIKPKQSLIALDIRLRIALFANGLLELATPELLRNFHQIRETLRPKKAFHYLIDLTDWSNQLNGKLPVLLNLYPS